MYSDINNLNEPSKYQRYFIDANVWIAIIKYNTVNKKDSDFQPYIDFFEALVNLNSQPSKLFKKNNYQPKIIVTSMLLSEIINAYLRNVAMPAFLNCEPSKCNFKKDYRENIHSDYDKQLKILISDIRSYSFMFEIVDDNFSTNSDLSFLNELNRNVDFNDLYYYKLMKSLNVPIVTDDKDFKYNDIMVFTNNKRVLKKL